MKPSRNDPCPCGSGKKYKQCCLKTEQAVPEDELLWRRIRRTIDASAMQLLNFADSHFGPQGLMEAWGEFVGQEDEPFDPHTPHMQIFMPWFLYDWLPAPEYSQVKPDALDGRTAGRAYLDKKGRHLDPLLARYIEQCCVAPFSFYDVISVRPGSGFVLRDIMTGEEVDVTEHSASRQAQAGDILLGKVVKIDQIAMLEACSGVVFPPIEKSAILDLRKRIEERELPITAELLRECDLDMLDLYLEISERLLNPVMPQLHNTDGDPLLFHRVMYEIESPRAAFDGLKKLCLTNLAEDLLAAAELDASGDLHKIEFPWQKRGNAKHGTWDNTVLGHIKIEGRKLTAEVNSENRANQIRAIIGQELPGARYKTTLIESPQAMLAHSKNEGETARSKQIQQEQEELNSLPEVQAHITEFMREHYRKWPEEALPALNGKTPLQAIKTRDGKEMVEALLTEFERSGKNTGQPLDPAIIAELRERLGLS